MSKRGVVIAMMLVGCMPDDDDGGTTVPPDAHEEDTVREGVWEPMPGASIWDASLALDGNTLWWAVSQRVSPAGEYLYDDQVWITATSVTGEPQIVPSAVAPASGASDHDPDLVVTPSAIVVKIGGVSSLLRRYGRDGTPLGDAYPIVLEDGGRVITEITRTALIANPAGGTHYLASLGDDGHDVAIIDFDPAGAPQTTHFAGTPGTIDGGTAAATITGAARADGSTFVAWDRGYHPCISSRPSETLTTTTVAAGAIQPVRDLPDGEYHPAIGAHGDAVYLAWLGSSRISLARYPDVTSVIGEIEIEIESYVSELSVVMSAPDRGVIAWRTGYNGDNLYLRPFKDIGGSVQLGELVVVPPVYGSGGATTADIVNLGGNRYVIGWLESRADGITSVRRLFATVLELSDTLLRPAAVPPRVVPFVPDRRRCP